MTAQLALVFDVPPDLPPRAAGGGGASSQGPGFEHALGEKLRAAENAGAPPSGGPAAAEEGRDGAGAPLDGRVGADADPTDDQEARERADEERAALEAEQERDASLSAEEAEAALIEARSPDALDAEAAALAQPAVGLTGLDAAPAALVGGTASAPVEAGATPMAALAALAYEDEEARAGKPAGGAAPGSTQASAAGAGTAPAVQPEPTSGAARQPEGAPSEGEALRSQAAGASGVSEAIERGASEAARSRGGTGEGLEAGSAAAERAVEVPRDGAAPRQADVATVVAADPAPARADGTSPTRSPADAALASGSTVARDADSRGANEHETSDRRGREEAQSPLSEVEATARQSDEATLRVEDLTQAASGAMTAAEVVHGVANGSLPTGPIELQALDVTLAPPATVASTPPATATSLPTPAEAIPVQTEWLAARGGGTVRLDLHPAELGRLQIRVTVRGDEVRVVMLAQEPAAVLAANDARDTLAQGLASRDLRMEHFEVRSVQGGELPDAGEGRQGGEAGGREGDELSGGPARQASTARGDEGVAPRLVGVGATMAPPNAAAATQDGIDLRI